MQQTERTSRQLTYRKDKTNQPSATTTYPSESGVVENVDVARTERHVGPLIDEQRRIQGPANTVKMDRITSYYDGSNQNG